MKIALYIGAGAAAVLAGVWSLIGWLPVRGIEQPQYEVVERRPGYEIRAYAPMIVAEATNEGSFMGTMNRGFRDVADYIFGGNEPNEKIAMTSPVLHEPASQSNGDVPAAMTPPLQNGPMNGSGAFTTGFVMPAEYGMEDLPNPKSGGVRLREIPERRVAALSLRGYQSEARAGNAAARLVQLITRDGFEPASAPAIAMYDVPWAPPWMMESDILVPLGEPKP